MSLISRLLLSLLLLGFVVNTVFSQSACPSVTVTPNNVSICSGCTTLTANVQGSVATTSYSVAPVTYSPYSFTGGNPVLVNIDDTWSGVINLPFCFQFYGNTYTQCVIGSNAVLSFNTTNAGNYNTWPISAAIPSATPTDLTNCIMAPWHDIDPSITFYSTPSINWQIYGTAPCRALVVNWNTVSMFSCNSMIATSQIVLYETTNIIDIYIKDKPTCSSWNSGAAIEGIQDATGTQAVVVPGRNYPTQWTATNDGQRFTPTGTPQYSLTWYEPPNSAIGTANTVTVCPSGNTTYTAVVVNNSCAGPITVTDVATVNIGFGSSPTMSSTQASCSASNGTATATPNGGTPPYSYVWSTTPVQNTQTATGLAAGVYSVTVTDASGCGGISTVTVTSTSSINASASSTNTNCNANTGTATVNPVGGTAPFTYAWNTSPVQNTQTASGLGVGTYSVGVIDANGCTVTTTVAVSMYAQPTINGTGGQVCSNGCTTIFATGGVSYVWSPSTGLSCTSCSSPTACLSTQVTYTVVGTDVNGCSNSDTAMVTIIPSPSVNAGPNATVCFGLDSVMISASGATAYSWTPSAGLSCTSCPNPWANPPYSNTYTVIGTTSNGCLGTATVSITVGSIPYISAIASPTICVGDSAVLNANVSNVPSNQMPVSWYWTPPNTLNNPSLQNPTTGAISTTTYVVTVTDAYGCTDDTSTVVEVQTVPSITFTQWTPDLTCDGYIIPFNANVSSNGQSVLWDFGDGSTMTTYAPNTDAGPHVYPFNESYHVVAIVFNGICKDTVDTLLSVPDITQFLSVEGPNVFTPNGDNYNECFHPVFVPLPNSGISPDTLETLQQCAYIEVYDRWGKKMFETTDSKKCWDGNTPNGHPAKDGTYYYIAKFGTIKIKGFVELFREKK